MHSGDAETTSVARLVTRDGNVPATTALTTPDPEARRNALACDANIVMPDFTPLRYRALCEIYSGWGIAETNERAVAAGKHVRVAGQIYRKGTGNRREEERKSGSE